MLIRRPSLRRVFLENVICSFETTVTGVVTGIVIVDLIHDSLSTRCQLRKIKLVVFKLLQQLQVLSVLLRLHVGLCPARCRSI